MISRFYIDKVEYEMKDNGVFRKTTQLPDSTTIKISEISKDEYLSALKEYERVIAENSPIVDEKPKRVSVNKKVTPKQESFFKLVYDVYDPGEVINVRELSNVIGGKFANKPMTIGAVVTALKSKGLIRNAGSTKEFVLTEEGKDVVKNLS